MDKTYSFGDITEDTYAILTLADSPNNFSSVVFKVYNSPSRISINNYKRDRTEDYRTTITFSAKSENSPEDAIVHWIINKSDEGIGDTYTVKDAKNNYTIQAELVSFDGIVIAKSEVETVKIKNGLFDKKIWFFKHLFNPGAYNIKQ